MMPRHSWTIGGTFLLALSGLVLAQPLSASPDPMKVQGPESCGECHKQEVEAWKLTHHFSTFNDMHRTDDAKAIAEKMGIHRIKSESLCLDCHYTSKQTADGPQVIAGVSCESCHAAAHDWINVHNDYGKGFTKATEPADHRTARIAAALKNGMLRPDDIYSVAQNCYKCHVVKDEKLVNVGGHTPGSADFSLLSYSQGEVRHNFMDSAGKMNADDSPARLRMLYAVGTLLDLEYSLRAVARSTEKATYAVTYAHRVKAVKAALAKINDTAPTPEITQVLAATASISLKLNNADELNGAADKVQALAQAFAKAHDGSDLAALDPLLPGPATYKGKTYQPAAKG
ncbi:MAG TPA: cytochrome c family protein [Opitutaceae bacterium]|nr:cytochrome c family protein [Opitutaceae bacterium]